MKKEKLSVSVVRNREIHSAACSVDNFSFPWGGSDLFQPISAKSVPLRVRQEERTGFPLRGCLLPASVPGFRCTGVRPFGAQSAFNAPPVSGLPIKSSPANRSVAGLCASASTLAERTRFELVVRVTPYVGLANRWFQPLTHLSGPPSRCFHPKGCANIESFWVNTKKCGQNFYLCINPETPNP